MSPLLSVPLVAALALVWALARRSWRAHGPAVLIWRWLSGHPWHGKAHTDAGWLRPGVKVLHPSGHASRWQHRPRAVRAGVRSASTGAALALLWGLLSARDVTLWALAGGALAALLAGCWSGWLRLRRWRHERAWLRPLHRALAPALGVPLAVPPRSWLDVPRDFRTSDDALIRIQLPDKFAGTADARKFVTETVQAKLGLEDARAEYRMTGAPELIVRTSPPPPAKVGFAAARELVEAAPETAPLIGLGRKRVPVAADLEADSPHVLISAGSGGGKSVLARGLLAQGLNRGGVGLVLDVKRISHRWARGLPNVAYCRSIPEIHNALLWARIEVDRRTEIVDQHADDNGDLPPGVDIGPRFWLICEEMNALINRLSAYWRQIKGKNDPAVSPAVEALGDFLFMGRAVSMNAVGIAQLMTARTLGGPEARENFATRCLTRYTLNAWRMLVPQAGWPGATRHVGRWQIVTGDSAHETQAVFWTAAEARSWALAGTVTTFPEIPCLDPITGSQEPGEDPSQEREAVSLTAPLRLVRDAAEPGAGLVGLRRACGAGVLSCSLDAARWARANDPEFPASRGRDNSEFLYDPAELVAWERNRERAGSGEASA